MTCKNATKWYNTAKPLTKPCTRLKKHYHQIVQSDKNIKSRFINNNLNVQGCTILYKHCTIQFENVVQHQIKYYLKHFTKYYTKHCKLGCTMCTMLYNLSEKGCTTPHEIFINKVVLSFRKYCTINCTAKHKLLYNLGQYVQYCTKPCTISLSNPFFSCTTFQVVYGVQPFVQSCTTYVQCCTKLYRLYRLYKIVYNIVTVWFADALLVLRLFNLKLNLKNSDE